MRSAFLAVFACTLAAVADGFASPSAMRAPQAMRAPRSELASLRMSTRGVVITGGAGGVGYAYADEFVRRGHWVVICDVKDPEPAVQAIRQKHQGGMGRVYGTICDVSDADSVGKLADFAKDSIGTVHYWINNAGINGGRRPFTTLTSKQVEAVVKVNLVGVLVCTQVALALMQTQKGVESHIFNTVGSGVKGGGTPGYVAYGATKRGLPQMTESLVKELTEGVPGFDVPPPPGTVNVHTLSPGMVFTDLLLNDSTPELRKFPFGVLAAQPEEVAEDLVPKILDTSGTGKSIEFLTPDKVRPRPVGIPASTRSSSADCSIARANPAAARARRHPLFCAPLRAGSHQVLPQVCPGREVGVHRRRRQRHQEAGGAVPRQRRQGAVLRRGGRGWAGGEVGWRQRGRWGEWTCRVCGGAQWRDAQWCELSQQRSPTPTAPWRAHGHGHGPSLGPRPRAPGLVVESICATRM